MLQIVPSMDDGNLIIPPVYQFLIFDGTDLDFQNSDAVAIMPHQRTGFLLVPFSHLLVTAVEIAGKGEIINT